jgi:hypothetical protein
VLAKALELEPGLAASPIFAEREMVRFRSDWRMMILSGQSPDFCGKSLNVQGPQRGESKILT